MHCGLRTGSSTSKSFIDGWYLKEYAVKRGWDLRGFEVKPRVIGSVVLASVARRTRL